MRTANGIEYTDTSYHKLLEEFDIAKRIFASNKCTKTATKVKELRNKISSIEYDIHLREHGEQSIATDLQRVVSKYRYLLPTQRKNDQFVNKESDLF